MMREESAADEEGGDEFDVFDKDLRNSWGYFQGDPSGTRDEEDAGLGGEHSWQRPFSKTHVSGAGASGSPSADYLKSVYRQLVRILHPDTNKSMTNEQQDLWHEVQEAYAWCDIQRLERLLQDGDRRSCGGSRLRRYPDLPHYGSATRH